MKPPVTMVCSIPVSAAWNAFCRCCSLPAITNSTAAEFMPATASSVITSNSSKATTSAAPRCPPPPSVLKRSEEHTSELQSQTNLVCRLLLEKQQHALCTEQRN